MAIYCDQQALSFTIICMQDVVESQKTNTTGEHWLENPGKKNALFSVIAVGQLFGTVPIVPIMHAIGLRYTFALYGLVAACGTLMLPLAVEFGHVFLMVTRLLQGFAMAIAFVSVAAITSHWSVLIESGTYIAILSCSPQFASVLTMPLASAFCESSFGWRYLYYTLGIASLAAVVAFFCLYRDDPKNHWMVSSRELSAISLGKEGQSSREPVPYKEICLDRTMQAVLLTTFGGNTAFFIFLHYGPTFINKALGFDIAETGFATALPYALCVVLKFVAGPLFDRSTFISEKYRMIMFASLSQGVMVICFLVLSQASNRLVAQIAYSAAAAFNGLNIVGSIKCAQVRRKSARISNRGVDSLNHFRCVPEFFSSSRYSLDFN
ncbi:transporter, major facilitator family protein [Teladorsagia circumcincta]|uniref:Transporter, major facilitator family protein n=1 Tax=Teladorsagia circumcincta TaxID=45464 RepID=A0A2G9UG09_TELCI|nr:transporter, major facilitator family protein [Teladorsagia circumcincta]